MDSMVISSPSFGFNAYQLKLAAIIAMAADHLGAVLFPGFIPLRIIGRLTAPIMAFFVAEGFLKTRNVYRYLLRLSAFGLLSMLPYYLVFKKSPFNIFFDLMLGLLVIQLSTKVKQDYLKWGIACLAAGLAFLLRTDGMLGISLLVYLFYRFRNNRKKIVLAMGILYLGVPIFMQVARAFGIEHPVDQMLWVRPLALLSLPLLFHYNGERGRGLKYFFYGFYPVHLLLIYGLTRII